MLILSNFKNLIPFRVLILKNPADPKPISSKIVRVVVSIHSQKRRRFRTCSSGRLLVVWLFLRNLTLTISMAMYMTSNGVEFLDKIILPFGLLHVTKGSFESQKAPSNFFAQETTPTDFFNQFYIFLCQSSLFITPIPLIKATANICCNTKRKVFYLFLMSLKEEWIWSHWKHFII